MADSLCIGPVSARQGRITFVLPHSMEDSLHEGLCLVNHYISVAWFPHIVDIVSTVCGIMFLPSH